LEKVHFIAIGGAAMHNLAIALKLKGYQVTGSDDHIADPSYTRLKDHGLLPDEFGWYPDKINDSGMSVILGMHARSDNPELQKAKEMGLKVYSYPEYLYEQTRDKKRVVIAGSHGKTTLTAMIIHVLTWDKVKFDFMVGSQIEGFDNMVKLSESSEIAVFEGDEYLSSPDDLRPKFMHYKPHIALITGIAWDHINVFPEFDLYCQQFRILIDSMQDGDILVSYKDKGILQEMVEQASNRLKTGFYEEHPYSCNGDDCYLQSDSGGEVRVKVFGRHNMQNINGAKKVCMALGISEKAFYEAIATFPGARNRLQVIHRKDEYTCYQDFAHSPSKVKATLDAVREKHKESKLIAVLELHSFSSLNKNFIPEYKGSMDLADEAIVYYDQEVLQRKGMEDLDKQYIKGAFNKQGLKVFNNKESLISFLKETPKARTIMLLMSSGNFSGMNITHLTDC
jgi:UDP-N-acetylmuramate: L-alanyl-gamma-D-glutamyl-meso-diaminopimelate ligase